MALFKFRKGGAKAATPAPSESVEAMRRRARQRLIGAAVLIVVGVVGFPLLFDTKPRPVSVDIPIDIPDRNKPRPAPVQPATSGAVTQDKPPVVAPGEEVVTDSGRAPAPAAKPVAPAPAAPAAPPKASAAANAAAAEHKPAVPMPKPPAQTTPADDGNRAKALLDGSRPAASDTAARAEPAAADGRFVVQVGAFSEASRAREARLKLERAGLKTYTHVAETKDGKRIRVRVGPFASRAEADKAAQKVKGLDLPAAVLVL